MIGNFLHPLSWMKIEKSTDHKLTLLKESVMDTLKKETRSTLSATDVLAPTTMKNAAKCDTSCELHNPVSHQNFERNLHFLRGVCLFECLFIPTKKTLPSVLSESTVWSHSFGVECVQMEWMSNPFKLLKVMIISLVTILKPSNLRH